MLEQRTKSLNTCLSLSSYHFFFQQPQKKKQFLILFVNLANLNPIPMRCDQMLETAPSFSIYYENDGIDKQEDDEATSDKASNEETDTTNLVRSITIGDKIGDITGTNDTGSITAPSIDFCFKKLTNMDLIMEEEVEEEAVVQPSSPKLYLATGLGLGGEGADIIDDDLRFDLNLEPSGGISEENYKELVDEHPNHPLVLKNYALLLESKGDVHGAKDYYSRAITVSPGDGELLARYAQLVWRLNHDQQTSSLYFERAVEAAPNDCDVLGAYASFLWEIDDDDGSSNDSENVDEPERSTNPPSSTNLVDGIGSGIAGLDFADGDSLVADDKVNALEFYTKMLEQNPSDSLLLRSYARFLYQSKGDVKSAEKYYLYAIEADPNDGEILSEYAKLVWEIHHDHRKALPYFERATEAAPEDSHILGAYARFLWMIEEGEDEDQGVDRQKGT